MNFDIARDNELHRHLRDSECECMEGEFCEVCDPAEAKLRQEEERADLNE